MLGLSTSWLSTRSGSGPGLLSEVEKAELPIGGIELEYRIPAGWDKEIRSRLRRGNPRVLSIHNFFPLPDDRDPKKATGDLFLVTSEDPEERRLAVKHTINTIQIAEDLGARAVVLHIGRVPMEKRFTEMKKLFSEGNKDSPEMEQIRLELREERAAKFRQPLDWVLQALDRLNQEAFRRGIRLGVENRYYFSEIPGPEEIGIILKEFAGGAVGYWHDVGHSHTLSLLGFPEFENLLERYHENLVGIHLHDSQGIQDHRAPGTGEVDFAKILPWLGPTVVRIVELKPDEDPGQVRKGIKSLVEMGF
ncbi:MAG: sugar phosphate isomerase/epimerase [bacterium]|nr:sugar phosphate isomerase/epimerase [bacterium]